LEPCHPHEGLLAGGFFSQQPVAIARPAKKDIHVTGAGGNLAERNLAGFENEARLYVSSNHWLRHWYNLALENPEVDVTRAGVRRSFEAVVVAGDERTSLSPAYEMGFILRFICEFSPSKFLRLDPRATSNE
jgi:hypothetical protein